MKLNLNGSGNLHLLRDPVSPSEAANKNYVDTVMFNHEGRLDLHLTSVQNVWIDAITVTSAEVNRLQGITSNIQVQLDARMPLGGGTITGNLVIPAAPTANDHATNKGYVDTQVNTRVAIAGSTMTGFLVLHADPLSALHASTKSYVDSSVDAHANSQSLHLTPSQNTWIDAITASAIELNHAQGVTSSIQPQLDSKLALSGGTMTGALSLAGAPTAVLHAATKRYVDDADALKLNLSGGTVTGQIKTAVEPLAADDVTRKGYVDQLVQTHTNNDALHLTPAQNVWIDAVSATAVELNYLQGLSGNVQDLLATKFDKSGGEITGNVTLSAGNAVFVSKIPAGDNELVNKAYVDAKVKGQEWKDPVSASNLVSEQISDPPATGVKNDVYIVGQNATGVWAGKENFATTFVGGQWVFLQTRAIAPGDRFGVRFTTTTPAGSSFAAHTGKIATLISTAAGVNVWDMQTGTPGSTTLVFDEQAADFGVTYSLTDEGNWVAVNTSVNLTAGNGLDIDGNLLNVKTGAGLTIDQDDIVVNLSSNSGLVFTSGALDLKIKASDFQVGVDGLSLSTNAATTLTDAVRKSGTSVVTGRVEFAAGADLVLADAPVAATDAVNKAFVDGEVTTLQGSINAVSGVVNTLNFDPVTMTFVTTQLATKVGKAGDTMTDFLTLHAAPTSALHASTKAYVDTTVDTHAGNAQLHLSVAQKTLLNDLTVTAAEINQLGSISGGIQGQLDDKLNLSGGTLSGELVLPGDPVNALGAVPKQLLESTAALKVNKAGDTLSGFLSLHAAPTSDLHASTKLYVDSTVLTHSGNDALHLTPAQNTWIDSITASAAELNRLVGLTSSAQTQLDNKLALAGGTLTGLLSLSGAPTAALHAATKTYVDDGLATKLDLAGGSLTGPLVLSANPSTPAQAANKSYVDAQVAGVNTTASTELTLKLNKAGDTMTGFLTLHAAPTAALHAATKGYTDQAVSDLSDTLTGSIATTNTAANTLTARVDALALDPVTKLYVDTQDNTRVARAGSNMSGYLNLHADPSAPMHPATKQYVDSLAQGLSAKAAVRFATTSNLDAAYANGQSGVNSTLIGSSNGALVVDGRTPLVGDRVLVRMQTNELTNGDYSVQQVGDAGFPFILKRAVTVDESIEVPGSYFFVFDGDTLKATSWILTVTNPETFVIGTHPISVNQFSGPGSLIAGTGLTLAGNTLNVNTASANRIVVNADTIDLGASGVVPGQYNRLTVDTYGRVTAGSNPTTLSGQGITDAQPLNSFLTSLSEATGTGVITLTSTGEVKTRALAVSGTGLSVNQNGSDSSATTLTITSNATAAADNNTLVARDGSGNFAAGTITAALSGNATTATTLIASRDVSATGDVSAVAVPFDGSANVVLTTILSNTGITPGTYDRVTVDAKGRLTAGTNPTTLAGHGIIDAATIDYVNQQFALLDDKINQLQAYVMARL